MSVKLEEINKNYIKSDCGYYIKNEKENKWVFVPFEKFFTESMISNVSKNLKLMNEYLRNEHV